MDLSDLFVLLDEAIVTPKRVRLPMDCSAAPVHCVVAMTGRRHMFRYRMLIVWIFLAASTSSFAGEALEAYAQRCDEAIGITVSDFNCDDGILVPTEHHVNPDGSPARYRPKRACDRPNQLNQECDPGSRFQVLPGSNDRVFAVAHCRKQGLGSGQYGDIAVIQYNMDNGATCFYQALAEWVDDRTRDGVTTPLSGDVKAPSKGTSAWPWLTPEKTADIGCGGCHDNGPIIRSLYLSQVKKDGQPLLPGAGDGEFNNDQPYHFVGTDFASWRAYKVEVSGNKCNDCHRMGVSNVKVSETSTPGTARDLGIRATAKSQLNKNPHSAASPIWTWGMNIEDPPKVVDDDALADAAKAIKDCALRFSVGAPLPNTPDCKISRFTASNEFAPPIDDRFGLAVASWGPSRVDLFGVGTNGAMYHKAWDEIWRPSPGGWEHLGGIFTSRPAVVASGSGRLDVFGLGSDSSLFHAAWARDTGWTSWEPLGGAFASPPAVVSWGPNRLDIFGVGTDGAMYHKAWDGAWRPSASGWEPLGGVFTSPPAVVAWASDRLDVFGLGTDRSLFHKSWTPDTGWTAWEPLGGVFTSPPAVVSGGPTRLDVFGIGSDGAMYHKAWDDGGWRPSASGWESLGGVFTSPPAVVAWGAGWLDVFGLGTDSSLFRKSWAPDTGWTAWEALGGVFTSLPVVVSREANRLDILGIGGDAATYQKTWDGSQWLPSPTGWQRLGGGRLVDSR